MVKGLAVRGLDQTGLSVTKFDLGGTMALPDALNGVLGFLRAGYPQGVPVNDYVPLLPLLRRRLSDDEVLAVTSDLMMSREIVPVADTDAMVAITKVTDEMPSPHDTDRVRQRLVAVGWPVDDAWDRQTRDGAGERA